MSSAEHKRAVREAFSRSASDYDGVAEIQRQIARALVESLQPFGKALDAGCGTGYVARLLEALCPEGTITGLDQAHAMCAQSGLARTLCGDLEALPLAPDSLDLYCSSLAWQWADPASAACEAARVLKPGGTLAVATLGPASLTELREAFADIDDYPHVQDFRSASDYVLCLEQAGFEAIRLENRPLTLFGKDLTSLIRELRTLGAHTLKTRRPGLLGLKSWQRIQARYETLRHPEGLPLTYDTLYLYARKP